MKKSTFLYVVLSMVLALSLCSCGSTSPDGSSQVKEVNSGRSMDDLLNRVLADKLTNNANIEEKDGGFIFEAELGEEDLTGKADADKYLTYVALEYPASEHAISFLKTLNQKDFISYAYDMSKLTYNQLMAIGYLIDALEVASFCAGIDSSNNGAYLDMMETLLSARDNDVNRDNWSYQFIIDTTNAKASIIMSFLGK